jgi:phage baseplate assembly protein W
VPNIGITDSLKTDIAFVDGDMTLTPSGDLGSVSGLANLRAALFRRLITVPGSLVHRPLYGVGIGLFQNSLSSFSRQQQLAALITEQLEQDPRVQEITSVAINANDANPNLVEIKISVKPVGYSEQTMLFKPFSEAI